MGGCWSRRRARLQAREDLFKAHAKEFQALQLRRGDVVLLHSCYSAIDADGAEDEASSLASMRCSIRDACRNAGRAPGRQQRRPV